MSLYTESVLPDAPFAYWPFQELDSDPTAVDIVGGFDAPYNAYVRPGGEGPITCMRGADFIDIADMIVDPNFNSYTITTSDNNADAHFINDGNPLTYWDSGVNQYDGMWVQVVFPSLVDVSNFSFALPEPLGYVYFYSIDYTVDGVTWISSGGGSDFSMTNEPITYNGLGTSGFGEPISEDNGYYPSAIKGLKFTVHLAFGDINNTHHWKISEFKVYYNNLQNNMPYEWALQITDPSALPIVGVTQFTAEVWFKPRWFSDTVPYEGRFFAIFSYQDTDFLYGTLLDIFQKRNSSVTHGDQLRWAIPALYVGGDGTRAEGDYDPDWEVGFQWHHLVIMEDSVANVAQLFVDGVLVRSSTVPGQFFYGSFFGSPAPPGTSAFRALIGAAGFGPASDFGYTTDPYDNEDREERFFGNMAHLALYTHTLSPARVAAHFQAMKCTGVLAQGHVVS